MAQPAKLCFEAAARVHGLSRIDDGTRAAFALAAQYRGERTIAINLGGVTPVRPGPAARLVREAAWLLDPWGPEARVELRCLRPAVRRALLEWLPNERELTLHAARRRVLVLGPAVAEQQRIEAALATLGSNRRKMFLLAARDGEHCVWCSTPLTHRSAHATVDHIRCRSDGGGDALDNLVLACASCNHRRSNLPADLWLTACLAAGSHVDTDAVTEAIKRSERHHRRPAALRYAA